MYYRFICTKHSFHNKIFRYIFAGWLEVESLLNEGLYDALPSGWPVPVIHVGAPFIAAHKHHHGTKPHPDHDHDRDRENTHMRVQEADKTVHHGKSTASHGPVAPRPHGRSGYHNTGALGGRGGSNNSKIHTYESTAGVHGRSKVSSTIAGASASASAGAGVSSSQSDLKRAGRGHDRGSERHFKSNNNSSNNINSGGDGGSGGGSEWQATGNGKKGRARSGSFRGKVT